MSTNSIPVSYTGFRSTANAVGAYIKDWKLAAKASYTLEDLLTPGFLGSAVAIYRDAVHKEINGETIVVGGSSAGHKAMSFNAFVGIDNIGRINTIVGDDDDYVEKGFSGSKVQRVRSCKGIIPDMPYSELRKALKDKRTSNIPQRIVDGILLQTVSGTVYWICPGEVEAKQDVDDGTGRF